MKTASPVPELTAVNEAIERAKKQNPDGFAQLLEVADWEVYTDGSAPIKNPGGPIGWSSVFLLHETAAWEVYGGTPGRKSDPATSNNRAEIAGALAILELLHQLKSEKLTLPKSISIVCDSKYVVNCAQGKWKKHKNKDLWRRFDQLMCVARQQKVKVGFRWTRAHVGTEWNERADVLAKDGAFLAVGKEATADFPQAEIEESPKPEKQVEHDCHYMITLYSEMKGEGKAKGRYQIATETRNRAQTSDYVDVGTLDEAEYLLLQEALSDLLSTLQDAERDPSEFRLLVDSCRDLMLKQLQGIYGVKSERLQPLYLETKGLLQRFESIHWQKSKKQELKDALKSW